MNSYSHVSGEFGQGRLYLCGDDGLSGAGWLESGVCEGFIPSSEVDTTKLYDLASGL